MKWNDAEGDDPRDNPPEGFFFDCIITPYQQMVDGMPGDSESIIWFNGISKIVDIYGCILIPRNVAKDGTFYCFRGKE